MKFVQCFTIKKEQFTKGNFWIIARLFGKIMLAKDLYNVKRRLSLRYLGEEAEYLYYDLLEDNDTCLISDDLQFIGVATNIDGIPMVNEDGSPIQAPKGKGEWQHRRPIDSDPLEWYGESYPSVDDVKKANKSKTVDEIMGECRIRKIERVYKDGSKKIIEVNKI